MTLGGDDVQAVEGDDLVVFGVALLIGAAMYGLAREGGSYGGASRGKTLALGGLVGAILAGVAPAAVNMLFEAAR